MIGVLVATNVIAIVTAAVLLWKLRKLNASQAASWDIGVTNPSSLDDINPQHYMELQLREKSRRSDSKQTNQVITGNAAANPQQYESLQSVNQQNIAKPISKDYMELITSPKTYASLKRDGANCQLPSPPLPPAPTLPGVRLAAFDNNGKQYEEVSLDV